MTDFGSRWPFGEKRYKFELCEFGQLCRLAARLPAHFAAVAQVGGRWTDGYEACVAWQGDEKMDSLECTINAIPSGNPTEVDVFAGGRFQQKVLVYWAEEQLINFPVRNLKPRNDQALILTLIIRNPVTLPNDARQLGLLVKEIRLAALNDCNKHDGLWGGH